MDKAHTVQQASVKGSTLYLTVDGKSYVCNLAQESQLLAGATQEQRERFEVSPSGYGIHWPDLDEDLAIDGLIGVKHPTPGIELGK